MRRGITLQELALEVDRQSQAKRDFVASTENIEMLFYDDGETRKHQLSLGGGEHVLDITQLGHDQIAGHIDIPAKYYKRMQTEAPDLLRDSVNTWFKKKPEPRMVRTLDGKARAFLSSGYRCMDNDGMLEAVLPPLRDLGVEVMSCQVTPTNLYLKVVDKSYEKDIPTGKHLGDNSHTIFDTICPALVFRNSEVGLGALSIEAGVFTRMCTNLAVFGDRSMRKYHVGARADIGEELYAILSDQTRKITDAALWAQIGDVVKGAFDRARFDAHAESLQEATRDEIKADPVKVVEVTAKKFNFSDNERSSVLQHLIKGGDMTRYGLHAAITRAAEDEPNYDYASYMERAGGKVIELPRNEWTELLQAA